MQSINYMATLGGWITGLAATGITFSCIVSAFTYYTNGSDVSEIIEKIGKRLRAGVILILVTAIIEFFKRYWL